MTMSIIIIIFNLLQGEIVRIWYKINLSYQHIFPAFLTQDISTFQHLLSLKGSIFSISPIPKSVINSWIFQSLCEPCILVQINGLENGYNYLTVWVLNWINMFLISIWRKVLHEHAKIVSLFKKFRRKFWLKLNFRKMFHSKYCVSYTCLWNGESTWSSMEKLS